MISVTLTAWTNLQKANEGLAKLVQLKLEQFKELQRTNTSLVQENSKLESENDEYKLIIADLNKELVELAERASLMELAYED